MNKGRENCSAMESASSIWVMVQKKQPLPSAPRAPRVRCIMGRLVCRGSSGFLMKIGRTNSSPMPERKKSSSKLGSRSPMDFTAAAMTTSIKEPMETKKIACAAGVSQASKARFSRALRVRAGPAAGGRSGAGPGVASGVVMGAG